MVLMLIMMKMKVIIMTMMRKKLDRVILTGRL